MRDVRGIRAVLGRQCACPFLGLMSKMMPRVYIRRTKGDAVISSPRSITEAGTIGLVTSVFLGRSADTDGASVFPTFSIILFSTAQPLVSPVDAHQRRETVPSGRCHIQHWAASILLRRRGTSGSSYGTTEAVACRFLFAWSATFPWSEHFSLPFQFPPCSRSSPVEP